MPEFSSSQPQGNPERPVSIDANIGENLEQFATRLLKLLETSEQGEIRGRYGQVDLRVVPGSTVDSLVRDFEHGNLPRPPMTRSGLVILSPVIGEDWSAFMKNAIERALQTQTAIALEINDITFEVRPQERKVIFGRVNYHLDPRPITLEDVLKYFQAVMEFRRR